jgi:hypothetical protein
MGYGGGISWGFDGFQGSVCEGCRNDLTPLETKRAAHAAKGGILCDDCLIKRELADGWDTNFLDLLNQNN